MLPFCRSACTSSHDIEMLVELVLRPVTFCGAPSGSDVETQSYYAMKSRKKAASAISKK